MRRTLLPALAGLGLIAAVGAMSWLNTQSKPTPIAAEAFPEWVAAYNRSLAWPDVPAGRKLDRGALLASFDRGRDFLLANQMPEGRFNYEYDFVTGRFTEDDSQVRQAGALWGLALIHQHQPTPRTAAALERGLAFFFGHTRPGPTEGTLLIAYPGETDCRTGTVALVALSLIDYLRSAGGALDESRRREYEQMLAGYLAYLLAMQLDDHHFAATLVLGSGERSEESNPYFDGETLLALVKAARHLGRDDLVPVIDAAAISMAKRYTADAWRTDEDSALTKGFYQWGSMAFQEYNAAGWRHSEMLGDCVMVMAWWMIDIHRTLSRTRNTAYAYEGLVQAYRIARQRNQADAIRALAWVIDEGLYKLTSWQVGGPLAAENPFLVSHASDDPLAIGGVMNHRAEAPLRIDVTQHQMHAVVLALRHVYTH